MNIILIGPQGSGKGTQARILCENFNFYYFESGAYLRRIAEENPELKKWLAEGILVPDREMTSYLTAFLDSKNLYDGVIFDGFPRTVEQYNFWKDWLIEKEVKIDLVLDIQITEEETLRRLTARRMDPETGVIYNLITEPPPANIDQTKLIQREDDKPEAIKKRLALYKERTEPLVNQLKKETKVAVVDGSRPVDIIAREIDQIVKTYER